MPEDADREQRRAGRFFGDLAGRLLTAAILDADPALAAEREERARRTRDVWATDSEDGLKTIVARAAAGDAVWFLATINRIADVLAADGDCDPVGLRRSKAIGLLAQPALALQLLATHRHDPEQHCEPAPSEDTNDPAAEPDQTEATDGSDHLSLRIATPTPAQLRALPAELVVHRYPPGRCGHSRSARVDSQSGLVTRYTFRLRCRRYPPRKIGLSIGARGRVLHRHWSRPDFYLRETLVIFGSNLRRALQ